MNNKIEKTTLHPTGDNNIDLYPKTSADQIVDLQEFVDKRIETTSPPIIQYEINTNNGEAESVVFNVPSNQTSGVLPQNIRDALLASDNNYIIFNNEVYRFVKKNSTNYYRYYVSIDETFIIKCIEIIGAESPLPQSAWKLTVENKLYNHHITMSGMSTADDRFQVSFSIQTYSKESFGSGQNLREYMQKYKIVWAFGTLGSFSVLSINFANSEQTHINYLSEGTQLLATIKSFTFTDEITEV